MQFTFAPKRIMRSPAAEQPTFQVGRLWQRDAGHEADVSHLIDRSYNYHSIRELHWHLAERFARPIQSFVVNRI